MIAFQFPLLQPAEILALEEVLLDAAEAGEIGETLSFWESSTSFVALGYGNKVSTEVNQAACERLKIPILRRISGGGTVLQGPGVLNYSLVLRAAAGSPLVSITGANQFIMERNAKALNKLLSVERGMRNAVWETLSIEPPTSNAERYIKLQVEVQGHTDLAIAGKKFSGNAQRRKRTHLLFHGSILLDADLKLIEEVLPFPSLQPDYRQSRSHGNFLTQFPSSAEQVRKHLAGAWSASPAVPEEIAKHKQLLDRQRLLVEKYLSHEWNRRV
jgi:lipoate-protein ligase A